MNHFFQLLSPYFNIKNPGFFLFGHGVSSQKYLHPLIESLHVPLKSFIEMIELWEKMGFVFISMEKASEIVLQGKKVSYPWIHITFDDGYSNIITTAYPYLKYKKIPFTIFLSTSNIIEKRRFDSFILTCAIQHTAQINRLKEIVAELGWENVLNDRLILGIKVIQHFKYISAQRKCEFITRIKALVDDKDWNTYNILYDSEEVLTPEEVNILSKDPLVYIGSHGHNHYILSTLDDHQINFELMESKKHIKQLTGKEPFAYCFPNGHLYDLPKNIEKLMLNKYTLAFTAIKRKYQTTDNKFLIPRLPISSRYLPMLFAKLISLLAFFA